MNEPAFADRVCRVLDEELDHLPDRITSRLATARNTAIARAPAPQAHAVARNPARGAQPVARPTPRTAAGAGAGGAWLRWLPVPLATVLLAGGLLAVWHWSDLRRAQELAALDVAILADDLPLAAYADKGFGVYLRNTRR